MAESTRCCVCGRKAVTVVDGVAPVCGKCYLGHKERLPAGAALNFQTCYDDGTGIKSHIPPHVPVAAVGKRRR